MRAPDRSTRTEENVTAVDELVGLLSQEGQLQTRQVSTETGFIDVINVFYVFYSGHVF